MAVSEVVGTVGTKVGGTLGSGLAIGAKVVPFLILGVILGWLLLKVYDSMFVYTIQLDLKQVVGNGKRMFRETARIKKLKNGARMWYLKRLRIEKLPAPNKTWIHGPGNKIVVQGWLLNDNQIIWSEDNFSSAELDKKITEALKKEANKEELSGEERALLTFNEQYQPVTTDDRLALANAMEEADFGKKTLSQLIDKYLPLGLLILVIALLLFGGGYYYKGLAEPTKEILAMVAPISENNKIATDNLIQLKNDVQLLKADIQTLKTQPSGGD